jgi:hypothetical protein
VPSAKARQLGRGTTSSLGGFPTYRVRSTSAAQWLEGRRAVALPDLAATGAKLHRQTLDSGPCEFATVQDPHAFGRVALVFHVERLLVSGRMLGTAVWVSVSGRGTANSDRGAWDVSEWGRLSAANPGSAVRRRSSRVSLPKHRSVAEGEGLGRASRLRQPTTYRGWVRMLEPSAALGGAAPRELLTDPADLSAPGRRHPGSMPR